MFSCRTQKRDYSAVGLALLTILTTPAAALGQGSNGPTAPFWQQLLLASIGPVLGTGVLGVSASLIVQSFQDRRRAVQEAEQERQRQDERAAADRLRDHEVKIRLIEEMTVAAGALYFALQHYWRRTTREREAVAAEAKAALRIELDAQYRKTGIAAAGLETRLKLFFQTDNPWRLWHAAHDILTVRYFQLIDLATDNLIAANACDQEAGVWHSGLTKQQLKNLAAKALFDVYRDRLNNAARAVLNEPLVRPN